MSVKPLFRYDGRLVDLNEYLDEHYSMLDKPIDLWYEEELEEGIDS